MLDRTATRPADVVLSAPQTADDYTPALAADVAASELGADDNQWHDGAGRYFANEADAAMWRRVEAEKRADYTRRVREYEARVAARRADYLAREAAFEAALRSTGRAA